MTPDPARIRVRVGRNQRNAHRIIVAGGAVARTPCTNAFAASCGVRHNCGGGGERNYVKYTFLKVDPAWRRRTPAERAADKREFAAACGAFGEDHFLRTYSLVGTRGDCDLMVRAIARRLEPIHELHVLLNQSGLMRYAECRTPTWR